MEKFKISPAKEKRFPYHVKNSAGITIRKYGKKKDALRAIKRLNNGK